MKKSGEPIKVYVSEWELDTIASALKLGADGLFANYEDVHKVNVAIALVSQLEERRKLEVQRRIKRREQAEARKAGV